jgi:hypothetical protein
MMDQSKVPIPVFETPQRNKYKWTTSTDRLSKMIGGSRGLDKIDRRE